MPSWVRRSEGRCIEASVQDGESYLPYSSIQIRVPTDPSYLTWNVTLNPARLNSKKVAGVTPARVQGLEAGVTNVAQQSGKPENRERDGLPDNSRQPCQENVRRLRTGRFLCGVCPSWLR